MDDLISRQAAIDALEESKRIYVDRRVIIGKMQDIVSNLPSAQPERKKRKWIYNPRWVETSYSHGWHRLVCSNCGETATCRTKDIPKICPNCGADMRDEQDG